MAISWILFVISRPSSSISSPTTAVSLRGKNPVCTITPSCGSVEVDDGTLKSSWVSTNRPPFSAPVTADVAAFDVMILIPDPCDSARGTFPVIPNLPVPALAQSQIRRGELS